LWENWEENFSFSGAHQKKTDPETDREKSTKEEKARLCEKRNVVSKKPKKIKVGEKECLKKKSLT